MKTNLFVMFVHEIHGENLIFLVPDLKTAAAKILELDENKTPDNLQQIEKLSNSKEDHAYLDLVSWWVSISPLPELLTSVIPNSIKYIVDE